MTLRKRTPALCAAALLCCLSLTRGATANDDCRKGFKLVVPLPPGSTTDIVARFVANELQQGGMTVVVENVVGDGGVLAALRVEKAPTCTLGIEFNGMIANEILYGEQARIPRDLRPVTTFVYSTLVLAVGERVPKQVDTIEKFVAYAKHTPGINIGAGKGSAQVSALAFRRSRGLTETVVVPYQGDPDSIRDALGDHTQGVVAMATAVKQNGGGRLRVIGAIDMRPGERPLSSIVASPQMSAEDVDFFSAQFRAVLSTSKTAEYLRDLEAEPAGSTPLETADYLASQLRLWPVWLMDDGLIKAGQ